jgi:hypothetical protein
MREITLPFEIPLQSVSYIKINDDFENISPFFFLSSA